MYGQKVQPQPLPLTKEYPEFCPWPPNLSIPFSAKTSVPIASFALSYTCRKTLSSMWITLVGRIHHFPKWPLFSLNKKMTTCLPLNILKLSAHCPVSIIHTASISLINSFYPLDMRDLVNLLKLITLKSLAPFNLCLKIIHLNFSSIKLLWSLSSSRSNFLVSSQNQKSVD